MAENESEDLKQKSLKKFTLQEFGGAFGDWGTLIPFIIGYVSIVGLNPAGIFLCLGITNIILGIRHDLPLPIQPQKTIGTVAISKAWSPNLVISTGFGTGLVWIILGFTKKLNAIVKKIPDIAVKGIQFGLGLILGWAAILFLIEDLLLGFISMIIIISLIKFEKISSALILTGMGIVLIFISGAVNLSSMAFSLPAFSFQLPTLENLLLGMVLAGIAQLFLTLTNVMIATVSLVSELFPQREHSVDANTLANNMGAVNLLSPFIGGMPLCHGSGGLAAQYAFGARSGGSMIMEGMLELFLGLFFSQGLFLIFNNFPKAILGAMLLYTAYHLGRVAFKEINVIVLPIIIISGIICFVFNIAIGFLVGLVIFFIFRKKIEEMEKKQEQ